MGTSTEDQELAPAGDGNVNAVASTAAEPARRVRLEYLDGLRGLAALYVVFHHAAFSFYTAGELPHRLLLFLKPLAYGHFSVDLFIVLSGYCLMLPVARSKDGLLKGGFAEYIRRRGRRILPPYFAALVLSAALDWTAWHLPGAGSRQNHFSDITAGGVLSHLFLLHNLSPAWIQQIDIPMWSVATEWQIYFVFALLLLPIWRRMGIWPTVAIAFIIGLAPHYLMKHPEMLDPARFWYIGLFTLGMAGAVVNFSTASNRPELRARMPWMTLSAICGFSMIAASVAMPGYWTTHPWLIDPWAGLAAACLIIACTRISISSGSQLAPAQPWLLRALDAPAIRRLGAFSYSLYLVHYPVLQIVDLLVARVVHSPAKAVLIDIAAGVPIAVVIAYVFYLAFERRFSTA